MRRVRWNEQGWSELEEIEEYYLNVAPAFADIFFDKALETTRRLFQNPYMEHKVKDNIAEIRQILCYDYCIFYYVGNQEIENQNIIHTSRNM